MLRCITEFCTQEESANIIVDHSGLDARPVTMEEVRNLSNIAATSKDIFKMRKCAHVATNDLQFGLVRAWEIMVEVNGLTDLNAMVFKNRDDAIEWIKASD